MVPSWEKKIEGVFSWVWKINFCQTFSQMAWYVPAFWRGSVNVKPSLKGLGHAILSNFSTDRMDIELTKISK